MTAAVRARCHVRLNSAFSTANEGRPVFVIVIRLNIMSFASLTGSVGLRFVTLGGQITLCEPLKYQNIQCQCLYPYQPSQDSCYLCGLEHYLRQYSKRNSYK